MDNACGNVNCTGDCMVGYFIFIDRPTGDELTVLPFHKASEQVEMLIFLEENLPAGYRLYHD